ncbi:YidC/Oxa1 family membrane protein insertase [Paramaledivibacter caminithermalis]|jgi:YidC/Oxa1 family membrane protein insertase|uniref:Membrane protein insertase, YidC/Oxa1 family, C-terminal domain-containing protein n=1 Tax=Paramaledivibacter caminithermalis (strain DSM 15212 / CIP 107654 / DViRD3) TaxID=1121301 RepID=A0A1M6SQH6_PARC5|nr:YidC/Oxa1 family membrane protein insertase [Paramaledivibacter caminithermalis]SHK46973.1 membrane protein insertase, YidC/Oxa1 family, C-terminal domain-containing protein [Paramaledivibacter caminithermalis DSM 15212]
MNIITELISTLLAQVNNVIGDWGITIIFITLTIKIMMIPLTIKQRKSMEQQQELSKEIEAIKKKYHNDKENMEKEITRVTAKYASSMWGCLTSFIQLPIIISLYRAILVIPVEVGSTVILPWIGNLKTPDPYYLVPIISAVIQLSPNIMYYLKWFKGIGLAKPNKSILISILIVNALFITKAPVIIGLYWIVNGIYTAVEQLIFNIIRVRRVGKLMN